MAIWSSKTIPLTALAIVASCGPALALDLPRTVAYGLQQSLNGLTVASTYCLLAVAYALLHGVTGRIVLSFGDVAAFAGFAVAYSMILMIYSNLSPVPALIVVFLLGAAAAIGVGHVVQRNVFTPLVKSPGQAIMIASIGVSILLQELLRIQSHARDQWLPPMFAAPLVHLGSGEYPVTMTGMQAILIFVSVLLIAGLMVAMEMTQAGRLWRACSQNRALTELSGIDTTRIMSWSAAAAALFAAASGWIVAVGYGGVSFYMGTILGLKALFASIIGGFGTIEGAIVGGLVLAAIETAWTSFFPIIYRDAAVFFLIVTVLILKPDGILGVDLRRDSEV
jgi:branched-chain amino acid transport system permease protein